MILSILFYVFFFLFTHRIFIDNIFARREKSEIRITLINKIKIEDAVVLSLDTMRRN